MALSVRGHGSHRRRNALTGEWVLNSPQRLQRPWQGHTESIAANRVDRYVADCYLCPGNQRANGEVNPKYRDVFVFANDFPALQSEPAGPSDDAHPELFRSGHATGLCQVACYSPRHDLTLADLDHTAVTKVARLWSDLDREAGERSSIHYVQIFENRGEIMGCSNPHPHCQLWATDHVPWLPAQEQDHQVRYLRSHGSHLLVDYLDQELSAGERLVWANEEWAVLVPWWAVWPFETLVLPRRQVARLQDLTHDQQAALANVLQVLLTAYNRLFDTGMPYSMGWHGAPCDGMHDQGSPWQLHAHYYPPLLRSATVRKFLVGYEMLAQPQRDLTPEQAAARLRDLTG